MLPRYFHFSLQRNIIAGLVIFALVLSAALPAHAHNGPPFPIISDQRVGPVVISLWTHPDVGTGTFFVIVDAPPGGKIPEDLKIDLSVQPVSGRLPEARYPTERGDTNGHEQFNAAIPFDRQEMWRVKLFLNSSAGNGESMATVEVTPPGLGRWDLLLFMSPFLLVGFLWFRGMARRRKLQRALEEAELKPQGS